MTAQVHCSQFCPLLKFPVEKVAVVTIASAPSQPFINYRMMKKFPFSLSFLFCLLTLNLCAQHTISVKLGPGMDGPYTGRLLVYAQADTSKPFGQAAAEQPGFAIEVKNWKAGEIQKLTGQTDFYLKPLDSLKSGYYKFVAILDTNRHERGNNAPGNLYTRQELVAKLDANAGNPPLLTLTNIFPERKFNVSDSVKEVIFKSALLSDFRKEAIFIKAGIALPPSYGNHPERKYPVVYVIPGWGGTHHHAYNKGQRNLYGTGLGEEKIYVFLNPETQIPYGLHAFVDSRVNGPWGTALVKELMPYLEQQFRISSKSDQKFITGQSSGGYGAIWLALHFPDKFGGCWATSPDPVDFSNFTGVNIYADTNYFVDEQGKKREIFFVNGKATASLQNSAAKERFEGDGGQQQSFEAEFGIPGKDGRPQPLFDPNTGAIHQKIAGSWKPYDLAIYVKQNWSRIKKNASQKIRIYAGENDNFLLQKSVIAFRESIKDSGAAIQVEIVPGADHFNTRTLVSKKIIAEMDSIITKTR